MSPLTVIELPSAISKRWLCCHTVTPEGCITCCMNLMTIFQALDPKKVDFWRVSQHGNWPRYQRSLFSRTWCPWLIWYASWTKNRTEFEYCFRKSFVIFVISLKNNIAMLCYKMLVFYTDKLERLYVTSINKPELSTPKQNNGTKFDSGDRFVTPVIMLTSKINKFKHHYISIST